MTHEQAESVGNPVPVRPVWNAEHYRPHLTPEQIAEQMLAALALAVECGVRADA